MGVQAHAAAARQLGGIGHQPACHRERRARRQRDPHHRARRRIVEAADRGLARGQDRVAVLDDLVGRKPAIRPPEIHRAAAGMKPQADRRGGADLDLEEVAGVSREDVVVVGRRRAARARERRQTGARRCPARLGVDQRPHRVELDQPLEQRRLLSEAAGGPLVEVVVAVDEAGRRQHGREPSIRRISARRPAAVRAPRPARTPRRPRRSARPRSRGARRDTRSRPRRRSRSRSLRSRCASSPLRALGDALGGQPDGVEDLLVARAPAQVARPAPRGSRGRSGRGLRRSRSWLATISPGVQNPHCTPPASTNARCTSCSPSPLAIPSTVTTSRPCACAASTRHEHTRQAVEVDRTRSALALLARVLRSGEAEMLAQGVEQALPLPYPVDLPMLAVDRQRQAHRYASQAHVSVRRPSTPSA